MSTSARLILLFAHLVCWTAIGFIIVADVHVLDRAVMAWRAGR